MSVRIIRQGTILIVSLGEPVSDTQWDALRRDLLAKVGDVRGAGVVIDLTEMMVLDSYASRTLTATAEAVGLRGARTVVTGIQPDVAFAMTQLGLSLHGLTTALDVEAGVACLRRPA